MLQTTRAFVCVLALFTINGCVRKNTRPDSEAKPAPERQPSSVYMLRLADQQGKLTSLLPPAVSVQRVKIGKYTAPLLISRLPADSDYLKVNICGSALPSCMQKLGADGTVDLFDLPAGKYRLEIVHCLRQRTDNNTEACSQGLTVDYEVKETLPENIRSAIVKHAKIIEEIRTLANKAHDQHINFLASHAITDSHLAMLAFNAAKLGPDLQAYIYGESGLFDEVVVVQADGKDANTQPANPIAANLQQSAGSILLSLGAPLLAGGFALHFGASHIARTLDDLANGAARPDSLKSGISKLIDDTIDSRLGAQKIFIYGPDNIRRVQGIMTALTEANALPAAPASKVQEHLARWTELRTQLSAVEGSVEASKVATREETANIDRLKAALTAEQKSMEQTLLDTIKSKATSLNEAYTQSFQEYVARFSEPPDAASPAYQAFAAARQVKVAEVTKHSQDILKFTELTHEVRSNSYAPDDMSATVRGINTYVVDVFTNLEHLVLNRYTGDIMDLMDVRFEAFSSTFRAMRHNLKSTSLIGKGANYSLRQTFDEMQGLIDAMPRQKDALKIDIQKVTSDTLARMRDSTRAQVELFSLDSQKYMKDFSHELLDKTPKMINESTRPGINRMRSWGAYVGIVGGLMMATGVAAYVSSTLHLAQGPEASYLAKLKAYDRELLTLKNRQAMAAKELAKLSVR